MGKEGKNEEVLFTECKESVEDVFGWKILIFLPQNPVWKVFIMITVSVSFVIATTKVFYLKTNKTFYALEVICDASYFMDVFCATLHFGMAKIRQLRHGEKRPFFFLLIDYVSLIPLNLLFEYLIYREEKKSDDLTYILRANVILRSYQVPMGFSDIKKMTYRMKSYYLLAFIEVCVYYGFLTHFFGCFTFKYFDKALREKCINHFVFCIIENDLLTFGLLDLNYIFPLSRYPLKEYTLLLIVDFMIGFVFTFGFATPLLIYVNLEFLNEFFEYSYKRKQLAILVKNIIEGKALRKRLTDYFHYVWTYGKDDNMPDILNIYPLCFRKTIFCDIYWEALRHSNFLQGLSTGCKRSLALHMTTEFVLPKTMLFNKQRKKMYFMYLESGLIQVMAEENSESPILNLSEGTVLGEISLFLQTECKASLRTENFSTIHVLKCTDLLRVLLNYPKDMKKMYHKMRYRLKVAKAVHKSKTEICPLFLRNQNYLLSTMTNIKWLKHQSRVLMKLKNSQELLMQNRQTLSNYKQQFPLLETQLQHTAMHLPLLHIADEGQNVQEAVCLKTSFPWFLDPQSHFLLVWKFINNVLTFIVILLYPAFLGWCPIVPSWFFSISVIINFMYITDVFIQLATAVKVKGVVTPKFSTVANQRFSSLFFYFDILAALPLYLAAFFYKIDQKPFVLNQLLVNALIKSYKLLPAIYKLNYSAKPAVYSRSVVKFTLILGFSIYWAAAILHITGMECIFYNCGKKDWFSDFSIKKGDNYNYIVAVFSAFHLVLDIPNKNMYTDDTPSFVVYFVIYIITKFLYYVWQGECIASYVLDNLNEVEYVSLMAQVRDFMLKQKIPESIQRRVIRTMEFQWQYDRGNYITQKRRILEDLSPDLRDEVDRKFLLPILRKSKLFQWEHEDFLVDLCRKANRVAVPANSLLVTFGIQTMALCIIHKGYVQVNSFIAGDSHLDVSTPLVFKNGDSFPVLVAFSQMPSPITAIALTDCELLTLDVEDIVTTMVTHYVLQDVILALKQTDVTAMSSAKLGVSRIKDAFAFDEESYNAAFRRLKCLGTVLKYIFLKKVITPENVAYFYWELSRNLVILSNVIVWPITFGCCCKSKEKLTLIYSLLAFDFIFSLIDFYLRVHIGYYNNLGIFVRHPLATFSHYVTTTFLLDVTAFLPNVHILYLLRTNQLNFNEAVIIVHVLMRSLSLYRILGIFSYMNYKHKKWSNVIRLIKCSFFGLLVLHCYVNFMVYMYLEGKMKPSFSFDLKSKIDPKQAYEYYFYELSLATTIILKGHIFFNCYNIYNLVTIGILATLGVLIQTFMVSVLSLHSTSASKGVITYEYYFKSFVKYLNRERVYVTSAGPAIKYFDFKWREIEGADMQKVFSRFPNTLQEDILFPMYKDTLSAAKSLSMANEALYRALCRNVKIVTLMKASIIIFENQVQADIFFVHKGKCFVEGNSKVLIKGAIIGDIHNRGFMKHTITTLTQVDLLKISSQLFYRIIENFYNTKKAFELEVANADDFIDSIYVDRNSSSVEIEAIKKQDNYSESRFEPASLDKTVNRPLEVKHKKILWTSNSLTVRLLNLLFFFDAYITFIVVPIFISGTILTWWALTTIYVLDLVWIFKIILTFITTFADRKRRANTNKVRTLSLICPPKFDSLLHILSVLPIELIPVAYYGKSVYRKHCHVMYYCYANRLLRILHVHYFVRSKMKQLLTNIYLKLLNIWVFGFAVVNLFVCLNLRLRRGKQFAVVKCQWGASRSQLDDIIKSYLFVISNFVGGGIMDCMPETPLEVFFHVLILMWSFLSKAVIVSQMLVIMYAIQFTKSDQILRLQQLEKYLLIRDLSPALFQKVQRYGCNLLNTYREGAHPRFLKETPPNLQMDIMQQLYMNHLSRCYIFQDIPEIFLQQLVIRLEKFIFFPGDYIVEKGDIDLNMYFIHKGEVKCIELDERYPVLERTVEVFNTGNSFGIKQGIYLCCPHMNTYRAKVLTDVLVLNYYKWLDLRMTFPDITKQIYKRFQQSDVYQAMANETSLK